MYNIIIEEAFRRYISRKSQKIPMLPEVAYFVKRKQEKTFFFLKKILWKEYRLRSSK